MASIFTRIIAGELPGRFVWRDDRCVAILTIAPITRGHTLVIPIREVDHWLDLEADLAQHLMSVAQKIGKAIQHGFQPTRVGMMIAGLEVPHVHLHVLPIDALGDLDFRNQNPNVKAEELDRNADTIRASLQALGLT